MTQGTSADFHPRELELAKALAEHEIECQGKTGDWFFVGGQRHVAMRHEVREGTTFLYDAQDNAFALPDVLLLFHRTDCNEWLLERGWDMTIETVPSGNVKVTGRKRHSELHVERTEPTELAAIYAVLLEVDNLIHFGWA